MAEPQTTDRPKRPPLCDYAFLDREVRGYYASRRIAYGAQDIAPYVVLCEQLDREQFLRAWNAVTNQSNPTAIDVLLASRASEPAQTSVVVIPAATAAEFTSHAARLLCCPFVKSVRHDKHGEGSYGTLDHGQVEAVLTDLFLEAQADPIRYLPQTYDSARRQLGAVAGKIADAKRIPREN
jgi:hypothetical protein